MDSIIPRTKNFDRTFFQPGKLLAVICGEAQVQAWLDIELGV